MSLQWVLEVSGIMLRGWDGGENSTLIHIQCDLYSIIPYTSYTSNSIIGAMYHTYIVI